MGRWQRERRGGVGVPCYLSSFAFFFFFFFHRNKNNNSDRGTTTAGGRTTQASIEQGGGTPFLMHCLPAALSPSE